MTAAGSAALAYLRSPRAIRERCAAVQDGVRAGRSRWFALDESALDGTARRVAEVTRARYPDLDIPYHSRWRHFEAGGSDRRAAWHEACGPGDRHEQARREIDLAVVSVLLDAGAGAAWSYLEAASGQRFARSEGLGIASLRMFETGAFSGAPDRPMQADAQGLARIDTATIGAAFQVGPANPLVGLAGRAGLLQRLGRTLAARPDLFGREGRPGHLYDTLTDRGTRCRIQATDVLGALLDGLGPIWPSPGRLDGEPLGDAWRHPLAGGQGATAGWVPLHKLSQWLAYSLIEPFERAGVQVSGLDDLTALAEYRNGGLLIDTGVIVPRDPALRTTELRVDDEAIVEWRALTVALIDALAPKVRAMLAVSAQAMPLARVLEGGTWAAGRALASALRDGSPPLRIASDGTVF
jgi:hypothetical protein